MYTLSRIIHFGRSWWPRGLRHRFATARLLGLPVLIPPTAWVLVSFWILRVVRVQASVIDRSLVQRSPIECVGVSLTVIRCSSKPLHLHWADSSGYSKKERKNIFKLERLEYMGWMYRVNYIDTSYVVKRPSIFTYLPPTLSIFSLPALEDLFLLLLSIFSWIFPFFSSLPVLEWRWDHSIM